MILQNLQLIDQSIYSKEKELLLKQKFGIRRIPPFFLHLLEAADQVLQHSPDTGDFGIVYLSRLSAADQHARFLFDLEDYPPDQITPNLFTHSVFNAPAAYLTKAFHSHGPVLCLCGWKNIIDAALASAYCWLESGTCGRVLLVMTDEACDYTAGVQTHTGLNLFLPGKIGILSGEDASGTEEIKTLLLKGT